MERNKKILVCKATFTACIIFIGIVFIFSVTSYAEQILTPKFGGKGDSIEKSQERRPLLKEFDLDVTQCRQDMRKSCAIVQQMMKGQKSGEDAKNEALGHLKEAGAKWEIIKEKYQENPPKEYANDSNFKTRLAEIAESMNEMEGHLKADRAKKSFQSCSFACGLFVKLHEENGLIYALDRLFHLRKEINTVIAAGKIAGPEAVKKFIPKLLFLRDQARDIPYPYPEDKSRLKEYAEAISTLSTMVDKLAEAVGKGEKKEIFDILGRLLDSVNKPYGLAL